MDFRFHLSLAVPDLEKSRDFYTQILGCEIGRDKDSWIDVHFFGHQLTLHQERAGHAAVSVDHFGPILDRSTWLTLLENCRQNDAEMVLEPLIQGEGSAAETGKFVVRDPAGNLLEFKYHRDR